MNAEKQNKRRERIVAFAQQKFLTQGFSGVTMDEIAYGLGMGKGTLYKYFPSKEELMLSVIDDTVAEIRRHLASVMQDSSLTAAQKLQEFLRYVGMRLAAIPTYVIADLMRSAPAAYEQMEELRRQMIEEVLTGLIGEGIRGGVFRPDTDACIIAQMAIGSVAQLLGQKELGRLQTPLEQMFRCVLSTLLNGCLTDDGRQQLKEDR